MRFLILILFIAVPLAEIAVFIKVGEIIDIAATVALVILTAIIGVAMLKRQGLATLARAQGALDAGELPVDSVIDGVCLLVAGAFLLTPGFITDAAGFLLLVPAFRRSLAHWVFRRIKESDSIHIHTFGTGPRSARPEEPTPGSPVIDGEYEEVDPDAGEERKPKSSTDRKGSPWSK